MEILEELLDTWNYFKIIQLPQLQMIKISSIKYMLKDKITTHI